MRKTSEKSKTDDFMFGFASEVNKNSKKNAFLINQVDSIAMLFVFFYMKTLC